MKLLVILGLLLPLLVTSAPVPDLEKRGPTHTNQRMTFYNPAGGTGACGTVGQAGQILVALSTTLFT